MNLSIRAISDKHNVKISVIDLSEAINEICELQVEHNQPIIDYTLTQITVGNALLGLDLKNNETMFSSIISENGILNSVVSEFNDKKVRSSFRIGDIEVGNAEAQRLIDEYGGLAHAMGSKGQMVVGRSILNSNDKYYSNIEINHQKINEMFMKYLKDSDQIQSIIVIGVESNQVGKITKAVGMLLQMLPGYTDEDVDYLEEKLGNTAHIREVLVKTTNYEALIKDILDDAKILEQSNIEFECTCSIEKATSSVELLDKDEIEKIRQEAESLEIVCEFCNKKYTIKI